MIRMHGPDQDVQLMAMRPEEAPGSVAPRTIKLSELFKIIYDRLDYVRVSRINRALVGQDEKRINIPLSELCDIEAVTQQAMVEIRMTLGLHIRNKPFAERVADKFVKSHFPERPVDSDDAEAGMSEHRDEERPLTDREHSMIAEAWEKHKAAEPVRPVVSPTMRIKELINEAYAIAKEHNVSISWKGDAVTITTYSTPPHSTRVPLEHRRAQEAAMRKVVPTHVDGLAINPDTHMDLRQPTMEEIEKRNKRLTEDKRG